VQLNLRHYKITTEKINWKMILLQIFEKCPTFLFIFLKINMHTYVTRISHKMSVNMFL